MATVYRQTDGGLETRQGIHSVDIQPYLNDGWSLSPPEDAIAPTEINNGSNSDEGQNASQEKIKGKIQGDGRIDGQDPQGSQKEEAKISRPAIEGRLAQLQELATDWRKIKPVAEAAGITEKPADGWDAAVLPILVAEYGRPAVEALAVNATA